MKVELFWAIFITVFKVFTYTKVATTVFLFGAVVSALLKFTISGTENAM